MRKIWYLGIIFTLITTTCFADFNGPATYIGEGMKGGTCDFPESVMTDINNFVALNQGSDA